MKVRTTLKPLICECLCKLQAKIKPARPPFPSKIPPEFERVPRQRELVHLGLFLDHVGLIDNPAIYRK